jgi:CHAT domain-containing protein/tetratricopeptide (TPR) repeat protein
VTIVVALFMVVLLAGGAHNLRAFAAPTPQVPEYVSRDINVLEPGTTVERELDPRQEHLYQLVLAKDECVSVIVEQHGIDVVVQTRRPDGSVISDFQSEIRRHGQEQVDVVADAGGTYVLAIRPGPGVVSASYAIRVEGRHMATDTDRSMQEARALRTAAVGLESAARFGEARALFERALTIAEAVRGPDDALVGVLVFELAGDALEARDDARSESLYQRAIAILERTWGAEHPYPAMARSRLALLLQHAGQGPKAEALLRQATEVIERTLGTDHPWFAVCLTTQANLRADAGDLETAEAIERRALAILEKIDDTKSARYAGLLNNLGDVYRRKEDYARAQEFFERALVVTERLEGMESYHISIDYQNLGVVARERKDYAKAVDYDTRALSIRERLVGADHPDMAPLLNNLANVQHSTGHDAAALATYFRALRIWEKARGPYYTGTLNVVGNIARTYASAGDVVNAIAFQHRADRIIETQLGLHLAVGSERQKLAFVNSVSSRTDRTISLSLSEAAGDPDASALATLVLLQRKGRVLDAMTDAFAAVRQRVADPRDRSVLDQLRATTGQLARLALSDNERAAHPEDRQNPIKELEAQKERLEAELSARSAEFRAQLQPITLEAVQAAMPEESALVEFAVFRPFDPKAERNAEAYGPPHYAAYVIRKHGPPNGLDLGASKGIDEMIDALRQALRDPTRTDLKTRARAVDERVMRPLRASFGDATRLLISPDGDLNLVPFEAFVDENGRYLIERYATSYLTSGRDLLRLEVASANQSTSVVIVADPFFGEPGTSIEQPDRRLPSRTQRGSITIGDGLSSTYFAPLAGMAAEARAINALFPEATLLTGKSATKAAVERLESPRILHIASHGFFLQNKVENPLLRSGLALAGANLKHGPLDDGILTALEASALNLRGTKLVTLSACDSGIGEVRNGEGVYGLRRAFVLAGSETLVMTLWPVSDASSLEVMAAFYTGLRAGRGRGDSLRQAKLEMLKRAGRQHPFYWASFIQFGEWASLDGKR